jgi:hypothetical protein
MSEEKFLFISPSTLDRKSLILTSIVCVLPTLFLGWMFYRSFTTNHVLAVILGLTAIMFAGIFVLGMICTPYKYVLTNSHLIIKRHYKDIVIPVQSIKLIRLMTSDDKKGMLRTFGAEGAFGSWGYYSTSAHKKLVVFTRRYNNWTLVITDSKKYVIAPDDLKLINAIIQQTGQSGADLLPIDVPAKKWRTFIPIAIVASVGLLIYMGYKEPKVIIESNAFTLKGLYGVNLPFSAIVEADTIVWREMPAISIRTNGISLYKVHRGKFKTTDGNKIHMSIYRGVSPIIRIVEQDGSVYYINRKNADETRQIINKLTSK